MSIQTSRKYEYFVPSTYSSLLKALKQFSESPEPGVIIAPAYGGVDRRIEQILQDEAESFPMPIVSIKVNPNTEDISAITTQCLNQGIALGNKPVCLLIGNADYFMASHNKQIIDDLYTLQITTKQTKIIFFFESNIASKQYRQILGHTHLLANIHYYPLLDEWDAAQFLKYLARIWGKQSISKRIVKKIVQECGGQMWLLKQALREYLAHPNINLDDFAKLPAIDFRLRLIAEKHSRAELQILAGLTQGDVTDRTHLENLGLLSQGVCTISLLRRYLNRISEPSRLTTQQGKIYYEQINVSDIFSNQERDVLALLLRAHGKPVTRDAIADVIWGEVAEEKFSIWAVEQLIKRIRRKLNEVGVYGTQIKTLRGKGYTSNY